MSRDIRVLVIKLADRLHNMRTLHYLRPDKQSRIASETLEIFAPLAHRLGMNAIKWELEDLAFGTLHPKVYDEIVRLVAEAAPSRDEFLAGVVEQVQTDLRAAKIKATVTGRPKHYYSIYQKMVVRGRDFQDIYDLVGLRVLVEHNPRLLRRPRRAARPTGTRCRAGSRTTSRCRSSTCTSRCTPRCSDPKASPSSCRSGPTRCTGGPSTASPRTGSTRRGKGGRGRGHGGATSTTWSGSASCSTGSGRPPTRGVPRLAALRDQLHRGVRVHPQGRRHRAAAGLDPGRLRVRDPHRGRPQDHRRPGQRPAGAAGVGAGQRRRGGDLHLEGRRTPARAGTGWLSSSSPRARNKIRHYFTRERRDESIENGKEALARQMRKAGLPLQRLLTLEHLTAVAGDFRAGRRHRAVRGGRRGHTSARRPWSTG